MFGLVLICSTVQDTVAVCDWRFFVCFCFVRVGGGALPGSLAWSGALCLGLLIPGRVPPRRAPRQRGARSAGPATTAASRRRRLWRLGRDAPGCREALSSAVAAARSGQLGIVVELLGGVVPPWGLRRRWARRRPGTSRSARRRDARGARVARRQRVTSASSSKSAPRGDRGRGASLLQVGASDVNCGDAAGRGDAKRSARRGPRRRLGVGRQRAPGAGASRRGRAGAAGRAAPCGGASSRRAAGAARARSARATQQRPAGVRTPRARRAP